MYYNWAEVTAEFEIHNISIIDDYKKEQKEDHISTDQQIDLDNILHWDEFYDMLTSQICFKKSKFQGLILTDDIWKNTKLSFIYYFIMIFVTILMYPIDVLVLCLIYLTYGLFSLWIDLYDMIQDAKCCHFGPGRCNCWLLIILYIIFFYIPKCIFVIVLSILVPIWDNIHRILYWCFVLIQCYKVYEIENCDNWSAYKEGFFYPVFVHKSSYPRRLVSV